MPILPPYEHPPEWIPHEQRYEHPDYDNDLRDYLPRVVTIRRERAEDTLGFIIRGGAEHCCGIFIGKVQPNSEANKHGVKEGDQILACNETSFENIDHHQAVRVLKGATNTHLSVRFAPFAYRQTYERIPSTPSGPAVPSPQQYPSQQGAPQYQGELQYPPNQGPPQYPPNQMEPQYQGEQQYSPQQREPQYQGEQQYPPNQREPQYQGEQQYSPQQREPQYPPQQREPQYQDEQQYPPNQREQQYSPQQREPQYQQQPQYSDDRQQYSQDQSMQYSRNEQPQQYPEQQIQYLKQFLDDPEESDQYVPYRP